MHEEILLTGKEKSQEISRKYYQKNKERINNQCKSWNKKNAEVYIRMNRLKRLQALCGYGNKCVCCGETTKEFLTFDHINGGGSKHRNVLKGKRAGYSYYKWIIDNNFPKELQILCHNCNQAKGLYGKCPHEDKKCI